MNSVHDFFPVSDSVLRQDALAQLFSEEYPFGKITQTRFLNRSLNDTYLLVAEPGQKYILRIYRSRLRTLHEIEYELALLQHLAAKGVAVALPLAARDDSLTRAFNAPEGVRYGVVFEFAEGRPPYADEKTGFAWGWTLAAIHHASSDFTSPYSRTGLDLTQLLDRPLEQIRFLFEPRPTDWEFITGVAESLKGQLLALGQLDWGICHNDYYENNMHLAPDGRLTIFDFDMCSPGYRAFDISTVMRDVHLARKGDKFWTAFVEGYNKVRALPPVELEAAKLFMRVRHYWLLGLHASDVRAVGTAWMNDGHLDWWLKILREWVEE